MSNDNLLKTDIRNGQSWQSRNTTKNFINTIEFRQPDQVFQHVYISVLVFYVLH